MARIAAFPIRLLTRAAALLGFAAALSALLAAPARAEGVVRIQQPSGKVETYDDVKIQILHDALYVTSSDGKGTLIVTRAACSYQGEILVCFPLAVTLVQPGTTGALDLKRGTIYSNMTGENQRLPYSSTQLPPHGILLSFTTQRGTYINVNGVIDGGTK